MAGAGRVAAIVGKQGEARGPMRTPPGGASYIGRRAAVSRAVTPGARKCG